MLHFIIKIIITGRLSRERDVEMNAITVEEWEQNERKVSQKYKVANGHKRSQMVEMITRGRKLSQTITNHRKWPELVVNVRKRSQVVVNVTAGDFGPWPFPTWWFRTPIGDFGRWFWTECGEIGPWFRSVGGEFGCSGEFGQWFQTVCSEFGRLT